MRERFILAVCRDSAGVPAPPPSPAMLEAAPHDREVTRERRCSVSSIHDGDTVRVRWDGERLKIRLYCIDAPELAQRPWGLESRDHLRAITPKRVILIPKDKDRYGRTVGEILTDDAQRENLNLAQVASGNAAVYPRYSRDSKYYAAQRAARNASLGIWERPGEQQRPWAHRYEGWLPIREPVRRSADGGLMN